MISLSNAYIAKNQNLSYHKDKEDALNFTHLAKTQIFNNAFEHLTCTRGTNFE